MSGPPFTQQRYRLIQPIGANILDELGELAPFKQRENLREWVKFQAHAFAPFVVGVARCSEPDVRRRAGI